MKKQKRYGHPGTTLLETMFAITIMTVILFAVTEAFAAISRLYNDQDVSVEVETNANKALDSISEDLRMSGVATINNVNYPYIFTNGVAAAPFTSHSFAPPAQHVSVGNMAYGQSSSIVFKRPQDNDGDTRYTASASGDLEWGATEYSYVLAQENGVNVLQRKTNGANPVTVAYNVERVVFEDHAAAPVVGARQVRVTLYLWKKFLEDEITIKRSTVITLRNSCAEE